LTPNSREAEDYQPTQYNSPELFASTAQHRPF